MWPGRTCNTTRAGRVRLLDASGELVAELAWGAEGGPAATSDQSLTLDPDLTGLPVPHTEATTSGGTAMSPGARADGSPCP